MPQPMSTPTAAGTIAARVAITEPTVAPLAEVHVGHGCDVAVNERERRDIEELAPRRILDRHAVDPCLDWRIACFDRVWASHRQFL